MNLKSVLCFTLCCTWTPCIVANFHNPAHFNWNSSSLGSENTKTQQRAIENNIQSNQTNARFSRYPNQAITPYEPFYHNYIPGSIPSLHPSNYVSQFQYSIPPNHLHPSNYNGPYGYAVPPLMYYPHQSYPIHPTANGPFPSPSQILPGVARSVLQMIDLIARNDELHCVPRLLCEFVSGPKSLSQYKQFPYDMLSGLKIDMSSLLGVLATVNQVMPSPLLHFSRAAVLGYTNRERPESCFSAYPRCPRHPDELVNYLNNYNGGFFRYFGGLRPQLPLHNFPIQQQYFQRKQKNIPVDKADKRILTKTPAITFNPTRQQIYDDQFQSKRTVIFPMNSLNSVTELQKFGRILSSWRFPGAKDSLSSNENIVNKQKIRNSAFSKGIKYVDNPIQFNYPDRTGTGELVLDL